MITTIGHTHTCYTSVDRPRSLVSSTLFKAADSQRVAEASKIYLRQHPSTRPIRSFLRIVGGHLYRPQGEGGATQVYATRKGQGVWKQGAMSADWHQRARTPACHHKNMLPHHVGESEKLRLTELADLRPVPSSRFIPPQSNVPRAKKRYFVDQMKK